MMLTGLPLVACILPLINLTWSFQSTIACFVLNTMAVSMVITPSLTFMAEAVASAGAGSFGVGYGLYNMAWGAGLLSGPAVAGFVYERVGFAWLTLLWAPLLLLVSCAAGAAKRCAERRGEVTIGTGIPRGDLMNRTRTLTTLTVAGLLLASPAMRADVRSDQKARVQFAGMLGRMFNFFGGKAAREGVTTTIAVKGDRKATTTDTTEQIIDLGEEKVYDIDLKKKSYTVTTFAELRRRMEEARKKAEEEARKEAGQGGRKSRRNRRPRIRTPSRSRSTSTSRTPARRRRSTASTRHQAIMTITVREKGKTARAGRRHGDDLRSCGSRRRSPR